MERVENIPKLRFPAFNDKLEIKNVGDILKVKSGAGFKANEYVNHGVNLLQIENVSYGIVKWNLNDKFLPTSYLIKYPELSLKKDDIVLALNRPVTKNKLKIARLSDIDAPAILYQRVGKLEVIDDHSSTYIYQLFQRFLKNYVLKQSIGSDQPFISLRSLYKYKITLPSLPEQQKIATFLTSIDEKIQQLTKKKELLEQYKKGVMQKIFKQEIRFKDDDGNDFPDWEVIRGKHLFKSHSNKSHNGDLPILAATQDRGMVYRDSIGIKIQSSEASVKSYKIVDKGDFVISLRSFQGGIEYSDVKGICSPAYIILKPKVQIDEHFFRIYFKKEDFITRLSKTVVGIRDGKQISYDAFSGLKLPYPCFNEQRKIADFITVIDNKIDLVNNQLKKIQTFKKGLLQQMFV